MEARYTNLLKPFCAKEYSKDGIATQTQSGIYFQKSDGEMLKNHQLTKDGQVHIKERKRGSWKKSMASKIDERHVLSNLQFKAIACEKPLKDRIYKRYHFLNRKESEIVKFTESSDEMSQLNRKETTTINPVQQKVIQDQIVISHFDESELGELNDSEVLNIMKKNKNLVLGLQKNFSSLQVSTKDRLRSFGCKNFEELAFDEIGCLFVLIMIEKDYNFWNFNINYCFQHFFDITTNQNSSRIMQRIMVLSPITIPDVLCYFSSSFGSYLNYQPAVNLICFAISKIGPGTDSLEFILKYTENKKFNWFKIKNFKKVLISYITHCECFKLNSIFSILKAQGNFSKFFQDKFSSIIVVRILERGYQPAEDELLHGLKTQPLEYLSRNYFGYFIGELNKWSRSVQTASKVQKVLKDIVLQNKNFLKISNKISVLQLLYGCISIHVRLRETRRDVQNTNLRYLRGGMTTAQSD